MHDSQEEVDYLAVYKDVKPWRVGDNSVSGKAKNIDLVVAEFQEDLTIRVQATRTYGGEVDPDPVSQSRLIRMHGKYEIDFAKLKNDEVWQAVSTEIAGLVVEPELALGDDRIA